MKDLIIGIDLGTTYSCIGYFNKSNNKVEIIKLNNGKTLLPSKVGNIYNIKKFIGKTELDDYLKREIMFLPFEVKNDNRLCIKDENNNFILPEELSAKILIELKDQAEKYLKQKITNVVITVPAHFNDEQKKATITACTIAKLNPLGLINEPTAAALTYNILNNTNNTKEKIILVFDLGGGTLDISIVKIKNNNFEVLNTTGNVNLGGEDFTNELLVWIIEDFIKKNNLDYHFVIQELFKNKNKIAELKIISENIKKELSINDTYKITIKNIYNSLNYYIELTNNDLTIIFNDLLNTCINLLNKLFNYSKIKKNNIDDIVLVGGATRMIQIKKLIKEYFNKNPFCDINPDESIAYGATLYSALLNGYSNKLGNLKVFDVTPLTIGIKTQTGIIPVIEKNTKVPCIKKKIFKPLFENQLKAKIEIYQGKKHKLGECIIDKLENNTLIEIKVNVNINGIINIYITDIYNKENIITFSC